jgi:hypothetical protein
VRLRETAPGVLRIDHDADKHDDRVIALALASQEALKLAPAAVSKWQQGQRGYSPALSQDFGPDSIW